MPDSLARTCIALALLLPALAQQTVVLSSTDPDIIYTPPLCSPSSTVGGCTSPWQVSTDIVAGSTIVYTDGPIPQAGDVIPQMFINFRASSLYLTTTSHSNATVNFTLTAEPTDLSITTTVNTSISLIVAVDIPESQTTTLGVTVLQYDFPTRFDVKSITLNVSNASATSSILPSASLAFSSSPPTFFPSPSVSSVSNQGSNDRGTIIGAALGGVLGTLLVVIGSLVTYRYYKRRPVRLRPCSGQHDGVVELLS